MRVLRRAVIGFFIYIAACTVAALTVRSLIPEFGEEGDDAFSVVAAMGGRKFRSFAPMLRSGTTKGVPSKQKLEEGARQSG